MSLKSLHYCNQCILFKKLFSVYVKWKAFSQFTISFVPFYQFFKIVFIEINKYNKFSQFEQNSKRFPILCRFLVTPQ